jgi:hypothetical protein
MRSKISFGHPIGLFLAITLSVKAQSVAAPGGNIVVTSRQGVEHQRTTLGKDRDPSQSHDGRLVVFIRRTGEKIGPRGPDQQDVSELWIAETSGDKPAERLFSGTVTVEGRDFREFSQPKLSPKNDHVYFLIPYKYTTLGLVRMSVADRSIRFIGPALDFQVVPKGDFSGYLIIQQKRPYANGGFYNWYWLFDPDGNEMGLVGPEEQYVKNFLAATIQKEK